MRLPPLGWVVVFALAPAPARQVLAQEPVPGQRIRVTAPQVPLDRQEGRMLRLSPDTLALSFETREWAVPRPLITRLEVSRGRKGHVLIGLLTGAAVGTIAGLIAIEGGSSSSCSGSGDVYGQICGGVLAGSIVVGTGLGALVGALIRTERWAEVPR